MAAEDLITTLPISIDSSKNNEERNRLYEKKIEELRESRRDLFKNMESLYKKRDGSSSSDETDMEDSQQSNVDNKEESEKNPSILDKDNELIEKAIHEMDGEDLDNSTSEESTQPSELPETLKREVDDLDQEINARAEIYKREMDLRESYEREMLRIKQENEELKNKYEQEKLLAQKYEQQNEDAWLDKLKKGLNDAIALGDHEAWNSIMIEINEVNNRNNLRKIKEEVFKSPYQNQRADVLPRGYEQINSSMNNQRFVPQWNVTPNTSNANVVLPGYGENNLMNYLPHHSNNSSFPNAPSLENQKVVQGLPTKSTTFSSGAVKGGGRIRSAQKDITLSDEATQLLDNRKLYKTDSQGRKVPLSLEEKKRLHVDVNRSNFKKKGK